MSASPADRAKIWEDRKKEVTMKVAISAGGNDLDSAVDPRFGRCACLIFADTETMEFEAVSNPHVSAGGGAGISTAQMVVDKGAEAVITGNMGPNAYSVLNQAGIPAYTGVSGTVRQALEACKSGGLSATQAPTVEGHFGMQAPGPASGPGGGAAPPYGGYPPGIGPGRGMGGGRGAGGGRGGGRGRGRGRW